MGDPVLLSTNLTYFTLACGMHNIRNLLESLPGALLASRKLLVKFHDLFSMLTRVKCSKGLLF